jgi:hypothetical protein
MPSRGNPVPRNCQRCYFWRPLPAAECEDAEPGTLGACCRKSPDRPDRRIGSAPNLSDLWPVTSGRFWCGHFYPKG